MEKINKNHRLEIISRVNAGYISHKHINQNELKNRDKIFNKIIEIIEEKKYYLLGPEKSEIAKFIVENIMEIYNILKSNIEGY